MITFDTWRGKNIFMSEVLAFDWGTGIVGALDVNADIYRAYRTRSERIEGATRILECTGTIVSFNGSGRDLLELSKLLDRPYAVDLNLEGVHHDMMPIISAIRWPPDPGTALQDDGRVVASMAAWRANPINLGHSVAPSWKLASTPAFAGR